LFFLTPETGGEIMEQVQTNKKGIRFYLGWAIGFLLILVGILGLFSKPAVGFFTILTGLVVFPPFWKFVKQRTNVTLPTVLKIILFFVFMMIVGALSGNQDSTKATDKRIASNTQPTAIPTQKPTDIPVSTDTPTPTFTPPTREEWFKGRADTERNEKAVTVADLYKDPNAYFGKAVYFTCIVDNFPKDDNGDVSAINCSDPNDYTSNVHVNIKAAEIDLTKVNKGDLIQVDAVGDGTLEGKNAFGATIYTAGVTIGIGYFEDKTTGFINNY